MSRLATELQRLFALPGQTFADHKAGLAAEKDGLRRSLCLSFHRASDWPAVEALYQALQGELELPLPALSVDGNGYRLWFSLAESISATAAQQFIQSLCQRYLADIPARHIDTEQPQQLHFPPTAIVADERWIAFIDPSMGSMFSSEPWLEFPPEIERQGELLSAFKSIAPRDFEHALQILDGSATCAAPEPAASAKLPAPQLTGPYADPHSFLLAVINRQEIDLAQRIAAAKALLPYWPAQS